MINIYDVNGKVLMQAEITSSAIRVEELSKSDYISLSWNSAEKVILPAGAYIVHKYKIDKVREVTRQFLLLESYEPTQSDEMSWKYTPEFQHQKMVLSKKPFFIRTRNSKNEVIKQYDFDFFGTMVTIADRLKDFLNNELKFGNAGWVINYDTTNTNAINVSFSDNDFMSALTAITNAIGDNCEWHIDYDNETIHIGNVLRDDLPIVTLKVGENVGIPSITNSKEDYYNAFAVFGGTRNITQVNDKGENISSSDIKLQLSKGSGTTEIDGKKLSYSIDEFSTIDMRQNKNEQLFTKILNFAQIYPSLNTYVYNVRGREKYVLQDGNKIPLTYNADGSVKTYKTFTVWYVRMAYPTTEKIADKKIVNTTVDNGVTHYWYDFEVTDDLLINGKNIGCSFEANFNEGALSTPLAGRGTNGDYVGFELTYHKEASSTHTTDDVDSSNFAVLAGDFEIIYQEDNNLIIPTNAKDMIIPKGESLPSYKCNITVLYNIAMAESIYKEDAQKRLLDDAMKEIKRLLSDLNNYSVKSYPQVFEAKNPCLQIGQKVVYDDGNGYQLNTRAQKISTNIDFEFVQEITVGNEVIKGNTAQLKEDVKEIIASGGSGSGGGGNYTASQLKNLIGKYGVNYFVSKQFDDEAQGLITFAKGLIAKGLADLKMGATFGNSAKITELGEAVLSAIKSLDYDNAAEQGFSVEKEKNGKYHAFFTNLTIWGKAIFHELEIRKLSYSGGNIYLSGAGSKLIKVVPVKKSVSDGGVTSWVETAEDDTECVGWKCYLLADNGTTATMNDWQEGDQARCQTMGEIVSGGTYQNASNKSYWRTIPDGGVSTQNEKIYGTKTETYLDEDGNEQTKEVQVELYDGQAFAWIVIGKHCGDIDGYDDEFSVGYNGSNPAPLETRDIPSAGDTIVLDGNRHRNEQQEYDKTDRQNVIILETTGEYAPRIACYANITEYKHTITKSVNGSDKEVSLSVFETSPKGGTKINSSRFEWISDDGSTINIINYRGDWVSTNIYHKNDQVNHNNAVWVCVANSGVNVDKEPVDGSSYWKKVLSGGKGEKGDKGDNAIRLALTNENSSVSCDKNGNPLGTVQGTIAILYDGAVAANADRVTYSIVSYYGLSVIPEINAGGAIDNIEIRGGNTSLKASINIKAVYENQAYYATYTITKVLAGSDGTPAIIYWLEPSATAIKVDSDGNANPSTITCKQYKQVGAKSPVAGDKKIYYRHNAMDSTLWNEYTEAINPATNVDAYEFVLADKTPSNSSAIIYDRESIPVIKDGQNGNDGLSGNGIVPAYIRSKDNPTSPTSTDKNNLDNGWLLAIPSVADVENVSYGDSSWTDYNDDSGCTWKKSPTTAASSTSSCLVTFTTTQANQVVKFVIKSYCEPRYDYIFLSEIDAASVPSKPTSNGGSRAVSGNGVELSVTDIIATAGTHTVYVCYGKDYSGDFHGDYGLFRIDSSAGIPLWQSNGKEVFTREDSGAIKSEIESWSEPFRVTGEDGTDGKDAVSYTVTLTRGSNGVTQGLHVGVTRYIGTACTTGTIISFGMSCKAYTDGTLAEGLTDRLQTSDNYIDFAAFPKAKSFTVELFDKNGNKVATGNYSSGDDAISILVEDAPLVFDTDDSGTVPADDTKTAKVKVMRGNANVTNDCNQESPKNDLSSNCMCDVKKDKDNECISVSVQGRWIVKNDVIVDGVNQGKVSTTSGYAVAQFVYDSVVYFAQVPFSVNVAKFTGSVAFDNKRYKAQFDELSKGGGAATKNELTQATSKFEQTAREISLSVSEKSVGRRNMLVGSAFQRDDNNVIISDGARIEINSGYQGTNCIKVIDKTKTGDLHYIGVYWDGSQGGRSIKIKKGKKYTLSCYYKTNRILAKLSIEGIYTDKQENAIRLGQVTYLTPSSFKVKKLNEWELFTTVIDTTDAQSDYIAFNFWEACNVSAGTISAWICRPMIEEGDTYNGWTLSEKDYDIIGANLIDNSRTLDAGGNVLTVIGEKTLVGDVYELKASGSDDYNQFYRINGNAFKLNTDYTISFEVRGNAEYIQVNAFYPANNTKYTCYTEPQNGVMSEIADDGTTVGYVTLGEFEVLQKQQRVWVHFRFKDRLPEQLYFQFTKNAEQTDVTSWNVTITRPKIEVGAVVTEYTERKSDLVDKASLKAAGIEITSDQVILYGNKVQVKNPKENPSEGYDEAAMFQNGKLNAQFINAGEVVAEGINAKEIKATKLNVTGDSKIGIWHITKVDGWGDIMQAEGTKYNGATVVSGIQYCPLFVRGGSLNTAYFRVGASCTEFSYQSTLNHFNSVWFGNAARIVCEGSANSVDLPTNYDYNTQYEPVQYIYSEQSKKESPALAINVIAKGFSGTPTAIQTNGAIRGALAPNTEIISYTRQISNGVGIVICTNPSDMTLTLPANPVDGQTLIIIQGNDKRVYIVPPKGDTIYFGGQTRYDTGNRFYSGTIGQFTILVFIRGAWQLQFMNNRP